MKALVLREYGNLVYEEAPTPECRPDEVLVAVKACGICGSDVHGMDGSTGRRRPPIIMGHEAAGVIAATGREVTGWEPGDRVTFDSTISCGGCVFCRRGEINLCEERRVFGVSCLEYRQAGAFADLVAVPQRILYRVPDALPFEHAALLEPFTIAFHAVSRSPAALNDTAVVVGCGMIGLTLVQATRLSGFGRIVAVDIAPEKLALAASLGATDTLDSAKLDVVEEILHLTHGVGADHAFEAVGLAGTVALAIRSVRKGGAVTLVGNVTPQVELPLQTVVTRELSLFGSCASAGEYGACLDMMSRGVIDPRPVLSAVAPLAEGAAWFERLYRKEPGLLKVILKP
jgi:L-iditol 2-dehydrogenase